MDALDVLVQQLDEKAQQLREYIGEGKSESFEEYKRLCGEIKGLLIARGYTLDLKQRLEHSDE
jgi:hypothetical protein